MARLPEAAAGQGTVIMQAWQQTYVFSQPDIQDEHRRLFALADHYYGLSKTSGQRRYRRAILEELVILLRLHFEHECAMLAQIGYPDLWEHLREHDRILSDLIRRTAGASATWEGLHVLDDLLVHLIRENGLPELRRLDE